MLEKSRARFSEQAGQSLVIITLAMIVMLGMAAVAIDLASWYQTRHHAQVAADGAALAAANCLADSPGGGTCTSTTDTTDAAAVATTYAAANNVTIPTSDVSFNMSSGTVTVKAPTGAPDFFAALFGISNTVVSAQTGASWKIHVQDCSSVTSGGSSCYVAFGYNDTCGSTNGVYNNGNSTVVTGATHSNGSSNNVGNSHSSFPGPNGYGGPNNCSTSGMSNTTDDPTVLPYPLDYSGLTPNTADDATPPACTTTVSGSWTYDGSSGVFCDPTGTITVGQSTPSGGATFIANVVNFTANGGTLIPYNWPTNPLLAYQEIGGWNGTSCSSIGTMNVGTGSASIEGFFFAPCSTISFTSNNSSTGPVFFEGYNVDLQGNSLSGDGPTATGAGTVYTGSDSLSS